MLGWLLKQDICVERLGQSEELSAQSNIPKSFVIFCNVNKIIIEGFGNVRIFV